MGSEVDYDDAFDGRFESNFKCGDLVSWKKLGNIENYGFIIQIYCEEMTQGRKFIFAKVRKPDGTQENFMLSSLTKES